VAKAAGVSVATVSRVMNGLPGVQASTVAHVQAAIKDLGYVRQRARTVRRSIPDSSKLTHNSIAFITLGNDRNWLQMPVAAAFFTGMQRGASAHGLRLVIDEMVQLDRPANVLVDRQVDGAIVIVSSDIPVSQYRDTFAFVQKYVPTVWAMNANTVTAEVDHIAADHHGIGQLAYDFLKKSGCNSFGYFTDYPTWPIMRLRGQSFLNGALDDQAPAVTYATVSEDTKYSLIAFGPRVVTAPNLNQLVSTFVKDKRRPEGLFICNDRVTSSVYPLLIAQGVQPGRDVKVISCDAEEPRLAGLDPRPMSIDIGAEEIGHRSVVRLINRIRRPNAVPILINVAPRLSSPPSPDRFA